MKKILFVCSGNTCRSAMAEAWMRVCMAGRTDLTVSSAGLSASSGSPASIPAREVIRAAGGDLTQHRSTPLTVEAVENADFIIAMTQDHAERIIRSVPGAKSKTFLLMHWSRKHPESDVCDPFGGDSVMYEQCFRMIREAVENLVNSL